MVSEMHWSSIVMIFLLTYNDLKAKGYDITEPELKFYGDYEMKLKDADGNLLLFLS